MDGHVNGTSFPGTDVEDTGSSVTIVNIFQLIFGSLGILGNLLCIIVFKRRSKQNQTNFLIIMQAAVDMAASGFLVSLTLTTIWVVQHSPGIWIIGTLYCVLLNSYVLLWSSFAISTFNLTIISIERYIAVVHPMRYASLFKKSSTTAIVALTWIVAPSINLAYNAIVNEYHNGHCTEIFNRPRTVLSITLFFWEYFFPVCIMIFSFVSITHKLLKMNRVSDIFAANNMTENNQSSGLPPPSSCLEDLPSQKAPGATPPTSAPKAVSEGVRQSFPPRNNLQPPSVSMAVSQSGVSCPSAALSSANPTTRPSARKSGASVRRLKITKVLFLVSLGYLVCWSPNQWYFLFVNLKVISYEEVAYRLTIIMATCNTCLNPFIYALQMKNFRDDVKDLFKCLSR